MLATKEKKRTERDGTEQEKEPAVGLRSVIVSSHHSQPSCRNQNINLVAACLRQKQTKHTSTTPSNLRQLAYLTTLGTTYATHATAKSKASRNLADLTHDANDSISVEELSSLQKSVASCKPARDRCDPELKNKSASLATETAATQGT